MKLKLKTGYLLNTPDRELELDARYEIPEFDEELARREPFKQLKAELLRLKVNINIYGVGMALGDGYCIHYENGWWLVYIGERGYRYNIAAFMYPTDAANYFLWRHVASISGENTDVGKLLAP